MAENVPTTATWNPALIFLMTEAFRDLGVVDDIEEMDGAMYDRAAYRLNAIVKTLEATGIHVWAEDEAMLFFQAGVPQYVFSGTSLASAGTNSMPAMACDSEAWVQFSLQTSYVAGTQTVTLNLPAALSLAGQQNITTEGGAIITTEGGEDITTEPQSGSNVGDNFGVVLDTGAIFWTTVQSVAQAPDGVSVTLTTPLPSSASAGNFCFDFPPSAAITRPLNVPRARLFTYQGAIETPMTRLSRQEYMDLPQKLNPGTPTQHFYSPQRGVGRLYYWPNPLRAAWGSRFTVYRPLADFLAPNNTADFPQEWIMPLRWILAYDLAPGYSVPPAKWQIIKDERDTAMGIVEAWDREMEDVQFGMDWELR